MDTKKIVNFLLMRSVFTLRNIISIVLVLVFYLTYLALGGKVEGRPNINNSGNSFGGVRESINVDLANTASARPERRIEASKLKQQELLPKVNLSSVSEDRLSAIEERLKLKKEGRRDGQE